MTDTRGEWPQAWRASWSRFSQAVNCDCALKPMVTSVAFFTSNATRVQAQLTNRPWDLNFGWVEEISFTPPKTLKTISCGFRWMDVVFWLAIVLYSLFEVIGF
jgi:hypothetical protein